MSFFLVIFYVSCLDGFGSVYVVYVYFKLKYNVDVEYLFVSYGDVLSDVSGCMVYILDYVYK